MTAGPRPRSSCTCVRSADRRRVLDAALGPQLVQAALDLERRALPDVAFEHLAVIADMLDDADGPVLGQAELLAVIAFGADEALDRPDWSDFSASSTFFDVMPSSSALIIAKSVHLTMSNHWSSPWRTAGPSGSLEMISGSTM